ncbi:hypothetical protein HKD37_11G031385 [Glycine soja]
MMRITKLAKYRLKAQVEKDEARVEKDEGPEWRRMKAQTYQGNHCGVYPDLSSFTGSGVYPDLSSFTGSGVYPDLSSFTRSSVIQTSIASIKRSAPTQVHIRLCRNTVLTSKQFQWC